MIKLLEMFKPARNPVKFNADRYDAAVEASYDYVVRRFSRGNVNVQHGRYMCADEAIELREAGKNAIKELLAEA